jgi:apolipoprotein N-acyltransferase
MTSVAAPDQETHSIETAGLGDRVSRHRMVAGMASGFLLWTSFPPVEWSWLAWIALVPLFWLATLRGPRAKTYLAAWAGGLTFWMLALEWVRMCDANAWIGWLLMALVFSVWWPGFLALTRFAVLRMQLPLLLAAPIIWVGGEFLRAYILSGFPWYYLAHSQFRHVYVIQVADVTGSLGISFLIAVFNALVVDLLSLPLLRVTKSGTRLVRRQHIRLCVVTILLGTTFCYGAFRVSNAMFHDGPKLALLQSNIAQEEKAKGNPTKIMSHFTALVERAVTHGETPDLIVWPETAFPLGYISIDSIVDNATLERQVRSMPDEIPVEAWVKRKTETENWLHHWVDTIKVPMLVGTTFFDHQPGSLEKYNSAILVSPALSTIRYYHKMHLVPFGEYVPFLGTMPWLADLIPYPGGRVPTLSFGRQPLLIPLNEHLLAVTICFEDTIPQVIARFFREAAADRQPDVLINLTNDGWFHDSPELDMHLAIGVFRAVEHRVPLARAVNTGLSALVDGNGAIRSFLPKETEAVLSVTVPLDDRRSLYTRFGDWLALSCLAITIGLVPIGIFRKPRRPRQQN